MNFLRLIGNREYIISCRQQRNIDLIIQIDNSIFYEFPGKIVNKVRIAFKINFEINALLYNEEQSKLLKSHFNQDLKHCREVNLNKWEKRPLTAKFQESVCRLLAPLL